MIINNHTSIEREMAIENEKHEMLYNAFPMKPKHEMEKLNLAPMVEGCERREDNYDELGFTPDPSQQRALDALYRGESMALIGSAGSGKSTIIGHWLNKVIHTLPPLGVESASYYNNHGVVVPHNKFPAKNPGIFAGAYTIRATSIIAGTMKPTLKYKRSYRDADGDIHHINEECLVEEFTSTLHGFAGYRPKQTGTSLEDNEPEDELTDKSRYVASRNFDNPNDPNFKLLVIDEASFAEMATLGGQVIGSIMNSPTQVIIMGDFSQVQAIGGHSILQIAALMLPVYNLEGAHRSSGILLEFINALKDDRLKPFFKHHKPEACNDKGELRPSNKSIVFTDGGGSQINIKPLTNVEQRDPEKAMANVAKMLFDTIVSGIFTCGVHMVMIPQRTGMFGSIPIMEDLYYRLDNYYKRSTYYYYCPTTKPKAGNAEVIGVADIIQINREPNMIIGIYKNSWYSGDTPQESFAGRPRSASVWKEIHEAHLHFTNLEQGLISENVIPDIELIEEEMMRGDIELDFKGEEAEEVLTRRSRISHQLLLLDLARLLVICKRVYDDDSAYRVQVSVVNSANEIARYYDSHLHDIVDHVPYMLKLRLSIQEIADYYELGDITSTYVLYSGDTQLGEHERCAVTAYQAQGSETPIAISVVHPSMMTTQIQNEPVYTMVSRARKITVLICPLSYVNGTNIKNSPSNRAIAGVTVEEKIKATEHSVAKRREIGDAGLEDSISYLQDLKEQNLSRSSNEDSMWWTQGD